MIRSKMSVKQYFFHFLTTCITLVFFSNVFAGPVTFSLTSIKPAKGSTAGGTDVTIKGTGFTAGATATLIAGAPCTNLVVVSAKKITCTTTAHAPGLTDLLVTNGNGEFLILGKSFKYVNPPIVESIDPAFGPVAGGTLGSIYGTNFKPGASAKVGGIDCTLPTVLGTTQIDCTIGSNAAGFADVIVINPGNISGTLTNGYEYKENYWTATSTSTSEVPSPRKIAKAIWTGTEMIVWGGTTSGSDGLNTGGRYNPVTDIWKTTTLNQVPAGRLDFTSVWTGTKMIVWGGRAPIKTNTGGIYDPVLDTWDTTSILGDVPSARYEHSAVWTGTEMIIWGGTTDSIYVNTGARYNPSTNTWTQMSTDNAPSGRAFHSAIWTGTEMIVWGGLNNSSYGLEDGGIYNPTTDQWTTFTNANGGPAGRHFHSAVWTGTEMIVWGGVGAGPYYTDGKSYDPATNSWSPISDSGAPTPRTWQTSEWTGTQMIIWGGISNTGSDSLATGGVYDLATDTWSTVTLDGVPTKRWLHTSVWTGNQMVVWGGANQTPYMLLNSGGVYTP